MTEAASHYGKHGRHRKNDFQLVWIITKGGPAGTTHIFGTLSFQRAMQGGHFGEGAAISNFMLPILVACVLIAFVFLRKED